MKGSTLQMPGSTLQLRGSTLQMPEADLGAFCTSTST